ncbi:NAD(P)H-dependent oxidoreductase [Rothia aeria]
MILTREQALEIFKRRVSTRSYDPARTISDEDFNTILEFGRLSPSSVGSEPWKFLVIQNKELREKLKPIAWGMVNTLAKRNLPEDQMQMAMGMYKKFQIHDMKIADDERALFEWTRKNTYIALANMLTGAAMLGIDSCPVEGMDYDAVTQLLTEEGLLDPEDYGVSVAATFGYRSREIDPKPRKPLDELVVWAK